MTVQFQFQNLLAHVCERNAATLCRKEGRKEGRKLGCRYVGFLIANGPFFMNSESQIGTVLQGCERQVRTSGRGWIQPQPATQPAPKSPKKVGHGRSPLFTGVWGAD